MYIQIFEGYNFCRQSKSRIFAALFSKIICYQPLSSICIVIVLKIFEDLVLVNHRLPTKTAEIKVLENLYVYGIANFLSKAIINNNRNELELSIESALKSCPLLL